MIESEASRLRADNERLTISANHEKATRQKAEAEVERLRAADIQLRNRIRKFALLWHVPQADVDAALDGRKA